MYYKVVYLIKSLFYYIRLNLQNASHKQDFYVAFQQISISPQCENQSSKYTVQGGKQAFIHCVVWDCSQLLGVSS